MRQPYWPMPSLRAGNKHLATQNIPAKTRILQADRHRDQSVVVGGGYFLEGHEVLMYIREGSCATLRHSSVVRACRTRLSIRLKFGCHPLDLCGRRAYLRAKTSRVSASLFRQSKEGRHTPFSYAHHRWKSVRA